MVPGSFDERGLLLAATGGKTGKPRGHRAAADAGDPIGGPAASREMDFPGNTSRPDIFPYRVVLPRTSSRPAGPARALAATQSGCRWFRTGGGGCARSRLGDRCAGMPNYGLLLLSAWH